MCWVARVVGRRLSEFRAWRFLGQSLGEFCGGRLVGWPPSEVWALRLVQQPLVQFCDGGWADQMPGKFTPGRLANPGNLTSGRDA